ncbi:transcription factor DIVARICATA [Cornus florida]|uniref:transcription factor DIVARICATA n=1 Tax=Cornus florida TaxID=4283 RepID=UPI0028A1DBB9|nr:transcription factor DIVARICATA [Cornus florida]
MNPEMEVIYPKSYLRNSNWLFEESKGTEWTAQENKQFERALALFDTDTPERWHHVASMIPGKTVSDVIKQYRELEEDVSDIEAGRIPIPGYTRSSFTCESVNVQDFDGLKEFYGPFGKRSSSTRPSNQERRKGVPWTEEEHRLFLMGLEKYGKGDWRNISRYFVTSRTPTQVASHAQKYFIRQLSGGKDKRRSSIHDITTITFTDTKSPSPDHSITIEQPQQHLYTNGMAKALYDRNAPKEGVTKAFYLPNSCLNMAPHHGTSSYGLRLQEQPMHRGTLHGPQFGSYNSICQMQSRQPT